MSVASRANMFGGGGGDDEPVPKLQPAPSRKGSQTGSVADKKEAMLKADNPKSPLSPTTPAPQQRIVPQLKSDWDDVDVLPPEERLRIHRESIAAGAMEQSQRIIPQLKSDRDEPEVLSPEERRKLAQQQQSQGGERIIPKIGSTREEPDVLSPEERRRLAREAQQKGSDAGSEKPLGSRKSSAVSHHSQRAPTIVSPIVAPTVKSATPAVTPLVKSPMTPGFPAPTTPNWGNCPNCSQNKDTISVLESQVGLLQEKVTASEGEIKKLQVKVKEGAGKAKDAKKYKEEVSKKEATIARLEREVREADKKVLAAAMTGNKQTSNPNSTAQVEEHFKQMLEAKDEEIARLRAQVEHLQTEQHEDETTDQFSESASLISQADNEVQMLTAQIWSLETAIEFRSKEIDRLEGVLANFVSQVEALDHELAVAMKKLLEKGSTEARQEEMAVLGKPIEDMVSELKTKRTETKQKRRRPRKGKLSKENTALREEVGDLREEIANMRKAMAAGNPQMFVAAMHNTQRATGVASGGNMTHPSSVMAWGGVQGVPNSEVSGGMRTCCFKAAFVAAGEAEAQAEKLRKKLKDRDAKVKDLNSKLDAARHAIVSSAGMGYENELKLQQARKALVMASEQLSPRGSPPRGESPYGASPCGAGSPGSTACPGRSVSPIRENSATRSAMAWMQANPQHNVDKLPRRASSAVWDSQMRK